MAFFKNKKKKNKGVSTGQEVVERVRLPRGREILGVIEQRLGGSRILVKCLDGKTRNCRVPGKLKRRLWLREGNIVLIETWEYQSDTKGNVIFKYSKGAAIWLKKRDYIKIEEEF